MPKTIGQTYFYRLEILGLDKFVHPHQRVLRRYAFLYQQPNKTMTRNLQTLRRSLYQYLSAAMLVLALLATHSSSFGQGALTTANMNGRVIDTDGNPVADASVTILHVPTGTRIETVTRSNGTFNARSLRPGGPYRVEAEAPGFARTVQAGISLGLDRAGDVTLTVRPDEIIELEEFVVTGSQFDDAFNSGRLGASSLLGSGDIERSPVGDRSLNSLLRLDPRVIYNRNPQDQAISAGGISNRYNQIQIDGVSANDPFGLSSNNAAASRNVVPLDSIETITISTSPFEARQGGFTGAAVNAVTKSGTNEFSGSLYYMYRDQNLARKNMKTHTGNVITVPDFEEKTMGLTFGGPIIQDKLFFFISYEEVNEDRNPPAITNFPTAEALTRITAQATALGAQPGSEVQPKNELTDDNILVKIDWQINQDHRFTFRYNDVESSRPSFPGYGGRNFSFDSHWYDQAIENTSYIAQVLSTWTNDLSTEISISYNEYFSAPLYETRAPMVTIFDVPVEGTTQFGTVRFGTERSRHFNRLEVDTWTVDLFGSYELNLKNTLTFGYQLNRADVFNAFVQDFLGNYEFDNIEAFEAAAAGGWAGRYRYAFANPGVNPAAEFEESNHGVFIQNNFRPNDYLTLIFGLRADMPTFADDPPANDLFEQAFGFKSNHTYDGNYVIQPRVGFNLRLNEENTQQIRGGVGLFYGGLPRVWMSNSYSNTGSNFTSLDVRNAATPGFSPNPDTQPQLDPASRAQRVNALDPDFELPSRWKGSLAFDQRLGDHIFSIEGEFTRVNKDILYQNINRQVATVAFDGREILGGRVSNAFENDTIYLTNTDKGSSHNISLAMERPRQDDGWYWRASYTNGRVREVQYGTSSVARSNWANRSILNQGEDVVSRGELEIKHRFLAILQKDFDWNTSGYRTTVSLIYDGRSGLPFSFVSATNVNNDGVTFRDLIYVPEKGDPRVIFATPQDEAIFDRMVDAHNLKRGEVAPSGAGRYPFVHQFDLSIKQQVKLPGWRHSLEVSLDLLNVGNLINNSWGQIKGSNSFFQKAEGAVRASYNAATDTYTYSNANEELANKKFNPFNNRGEPDASRWTGMVTIRYRF